MTPQRSEQIHRLFVNAYRRAPGQRTEFVERTAGDDTALKREVHSLLPDSKMVGFLFLFLLKRGGFL